MKKYILLLSLFLFSFIGFNVTASAEKIFQYQGVFENADSSSPIKTIEFNESSITIFMNLDAEDVVKTSQFNVDMRNFEEKAISEKINPTIPAVDYLKHFNIDYAAIYKEVADQITPEMNQEMINQLVNDYLPEIEFEEIDFPKEYIIKNPHYKKNSDGKWVIKLWGKTVFIISEIDEQSFLEEVYDYTFSESN